MVNPYTEHKLADGRILRIFNKDVLTEELVWHRDHLTRKITVVEGDDWLFQLDNQLPTEMRVGDVFTIPANTYHRVKRGTTDLTIYIEELL